jgi:hypothetical protein
LAALPEHLDRQKESKPVVHAASWATA